MDLEQEWRRKVVEKLLLADEQKAEKIFLHSKDN